MLFIFPNLFCFKTYVLMTQPASIVPFLLIHAPTHATSLEEHSDPSVLWLFTHFPFSQLTRCSRLIWLVYWSFLFCFCCWFVWFDTGFFFPNSVLNNLFDLVLQKILVVVVVKNDTPSTRYYTVKIPPVFRSFN